MATETSTIVRAGTLSAIHAAQSWIDLGAVIAVVFDHVAALVCRADSESACRQLNETKGRRPNQTLGILLGGYKAESLVRWERVFLDKEKFVRVLDAGRFFMRVPVVYTVPHHLVYDGATQVVSMLASGNPMSLLFQSLTDYFLYGVAVSSLNTSGEMPIVNLRDAHAWCIEHEIKFLLDIHQVSMPLGSYPVVGIGQDTVQIVRPGHDLTEAQVNKMFFGK